MVTKCAPLAWLPGTAYSIVYSAALMPGLYAAHKVDAVRGWSGICTSTQRGETMPTYAVQRSLPGITMEQLSAAQKAAIETSNRFSREGTPVRYIRSNFYPGDARCTCLFEAQDAASVEQVNVAADIPFVEVQEVLDLVPAES
jgi:hypothetical protein